MSVCITFTCEKYNQCRRAAINNTGTHTARSYGTEGAGDMDTSGNRETFLCGAAGGYALYVPKASNEPGEEKNE